MKKKLLLTSSILITVLGASAVTSAVSNNIDELQTLNVANYKADTRNVTFDYLDPVDQSSFEVSEPSSNSMEVTFKINTGYDGVYQTFTPGNVGDKNNNIQFSNGDGSVLIDATLLEVTEDTDVDTYKYELSLTPDVNYEGLNVDITFDQNGYPDLDTPAYKTRQYVVSTESYITRFDNPFDTTNAVWNDDKGQIAARIPINTGANDLPIDLATQEIKFKYEDSTTDEKGTFGEGALSNYDVNIDVATDGSYMDVVIVNPKGNDFVPITDLLIWIDSDTSSTIDTEYEWTLKTYSDPEAIGQSSLINNVVDFNIVGTTIDITFNVDPVNDNIADTEAALESAGLIFGYDSTIADETYEIDENAQPVYPTVGTEFATDGAFTVANDGGTWTATTTLDFTDGVISYSDLWMQAPGVFRKYDTAGLTITSDMQNPVVSNSGDITNLTETSATVSFLVNNDDGSGKYPEIVPESAVFTSDDLDGTETITFVDSAVVSEAAGTTLVTYQFDNLVQGKTYNNIAVQMGYVDGVTLPDDGPRVILSSLTTLKENPIIENSGSIITSTPTSAQITFRINDAADDDKYAAVIESSATFTADGITGIESVLKDVQDVGAELQLTYDIKNLTPNTIYSNIAVDFDYKDGYESEPVIIIAGDNETDELNPIVANSGTIIDTTSDTIEISFEAYDSGYADQYATYADPTTNPPKFTGEGLSGTETVEFVGSQVYPGGSNIFTYAITGITPNTVISNIAVDMIWDDGFSPEPTLIYSNPVATEKLDPIIENSGQVTNIEEESATISFDVHDDVDGEDIYADYLNNTAQFTSTQDTTGVLVSFAGDTDNGDNTTTLTYNIDGLVPNRTYTNIDVELAYTDGYVEEAPVRILDEFTTNKANPVVENSGELVSATSDSATISFVVRDDELEDIYSDYDLTAMPTFYTGSDSTVITDTVELLNAEEDVDSHTTTLTYELKGLTANTPYTLINVQMEHTDGTVHPPTLILDSFTTEPETSDPIVVSTFEQDLDSTTQDTAVFTFEYRKAYVSPTTEITSVGYKEDGVNKEFTDFTFTTASADDERGTATVTVNGLDTNEKYNDVWVTLDGGEKVFGIDRATGEAFGIRTKGSEPIIANSGSTIEVTDKSATISYQYYKNSSSKNGDYYDFDPSEAKLGYIDEASSSEVIFPSTTVDFDGKHKVEDANADGTEVWEATYLISDLEASKTYSNVFVRAEADDQMRFALEQTVIMVDGFTTLNKNPLLEDSIKMNNIVPSDGTEAELSFWYATPKAMTSSMDESDEYATIDLSKTVVGYDDKTAGVSDGDDEQRAIIGNNGGLFEVDFSSMDTTEIGDLFIEVTYKLTGLEADTTYSGIYVILYDEAGNKLSKTYATSDNATFESVATDTVPIRLGVIILWIILVITLLVIIAIIVWLIVRFVKKHFALAIYMDPELSINESEIVFNVINVKHKKRLWDAYEGNLVFYASGRKIDAIFKRSSELHNGYKVYITEDFTDKQTIFSLLTSTKYSKFSVGILNDHHKYHVASIPSHKLARVTNRFARSNEEDYDEMLTQVIDEYDQAGIEERAFSQVEGFITGINRRKSTDKTIRFQVIVPHNHLINDELSFKQENVSFWHVHEGKLHEIKYKFVNKFGSLVEVDLIGLNPGSAYVGLTISFDDGKTFLPVSTIFGITREKDGSMPNLTAAKLGTKITGSRTKDLWSEEVIVARLGERLTAYHKKIITKKHYEANPVNNGQVISIYKAEKYLDDYINAWWKGEPTKTPKKDSKAKTEEANVKAEEVKTEEKPKAKSTAKTDEKPKAKTPAKKTEAKPKATTKAADSKAKATPKTTGAKVKADASKKGSK